MKCSVNCKKCEGYCELAAGSSLERFLQSIETINSPIGEVRVDSGGTLIVSGIQICRLESPVYIMTREPLAIERSQLLSSPFDKHITEVFDNYLRAAGTSNREQLKQLLRDLLANKKLIVPFKLGDKCIVKFERIQSKGDDKTCTIDSIKWFSSKEDGRVHCVIVTDAVEISGKKCFKADIQDYGKTFKLSDIVRVSIDADGMYDFVEMSRYGYIKPVVVLEDKGRGFAIDGTYIYRINREGVSIIGRWTNSLSFEANDGDYERVIKTVGEKTLEFIARHKRLIAPFMLAEANIVRKHEKKKGERVSEGAHNS